MHRVVVDVEDAVRRRASCDGEDTTPIGPGGAAAQADIGSLVVLIRENGRVPTHIRQDQTAMAQTRLIAAKLQIPIGADERSGIARPVKADREWEVDSRGAIIAMAACVCSAGDDSVTGRSRRDIVIARRARRRRCRR